MLRKSFLLRSSDVKGLYFPINHRIVDQRMDSSVAEEIDVQGRYRRHLRTSFTTGETRQTETPAWSAKVRPTHFISLPLPVKNVLTPRVKEMHNAFLFANQSVEPLLIPVQKLHITLGVFSLPAEQLEEKLAQIGKSIQETTREVCRAPLQLRFRGLGTFGHGRVLFVKCLSEGHYTTLDQFVRLARQRIGLGLGVDLKGNPHDSYVPHITVAKVRPNQKNILGPRLPLSVWADFQHHDFGDVTFNEVQVCSMKGNGENGYYKVVSTAPIS